MPWQSNSEIPETIRNRDDLAGWSGEQWAEFRDTFNRLIEDGMDEDEAIPTAIEGVKAGPTEADRTEWAKVHTTGPLLQDGQTVEVTQRYLDKTVEAFRVYQQDLAEAGMDWVPPVICPMFGPHTDSGRRDGDVLDLKTEPGELWAKIRWRPDAYEDRQAGKLDQLSVNIQPKYTDPQLQTTYSPYLKELSPTTHGKDKRAGISAAMQQLTASELDEVGLEVEASQETMMRDSAQGTETLATFIEKRIQQADDPEAMRRRLVEQIPREPAAVDKIINGDVKSPPTDVLEGIAEWAGVKVSALREKEGVEAASDRDDIEAAQGDGMHGPSQYLKSQIDQFSLPDNAPENVPGMTRSQMIEQIASDADVSSEVVEQAAAGEFVLWPDALTEAVAERFGAELEALRMGKVGGASKDKADAEKAEKQQSPGSAESDGQTTRMSAGNQEDEIAASDEGQTASMVEGLKDKIDQLESKVDRYERTASLNTSQTSSPGEQPISAADGEQTGGGNEDLSGLSDDEALEVVKDETDKTGAEAVREARRRQGKG